MVEISGRPRSAKLDSLAREGASRLAKLQLSIENGGPSAGASSIRQLVEFSQRLRSYG